MRKFTVDFKTADIGTIGRKGEHNYPVLEFLLDEDFQNCDFIIIEFGINGKKIPTDLIKPTGETLTFKLTKQLTKAGHHHVQLVGYVVDAGTAEPQEIMKSPVVHFCIEQNISGTEQEADSNPGLLDRILTKVHELLEKSHTHTNAKTLDKFYCDTAEAEGSEFPILPDHIGADRLKYNGIYLAYCSDGGMIENTEEWTDAETNEKFFRIHLNNGPLNTGRRDWIDIPISGTKEVTEDSTEPGIGTQSTGIQLQLSGSGGNGKTIPVVTTLSETANEGDVVLYKPEANKISVGDGGRTVILNWDWVNKLSLNDYEEIYIYSDKSEDATQIFDYTIRKESEELFVDIKISTDERAESGTIHDYRIAFVQVDGVWLFSATNSTLTTEQFIGDDVTTDTISLAEPVNEVKILDEINNVIYSDNYEQFAGSNTFFYILPELMQYHSGAWTELCNIPTKLSELSADAFYDRIENVSVTTLLPNKEYIFGTVATLTLEFAEGIVGKRNEYLFSFISGETATVLTLPSSVQWVNELTVEANKRYEISVVDNVALWCAVDMAVSE